MINICPSMMCADFTKLREEIIALEAAGADLFHIDVMDGHFVPNFAMGFEDIKAIAKLATIPFDLHLMVNEPDQYIERFAATDAKIIYVHVEACTHLHRTIMKIKQAGKLAGVAINPGTPLTVLDEIINDIDYVLIMSVDPGFAGQSFITSSIDKVRRLKSMITKYSPNVKIKVDGSINKDNVPLLYAAGAEYFVVGTAGVFRDGFDYAKNINILKNSTI
ncbi:ribulose-phosphate 3-epimerase [Tolumonas auensis DSM 9187]|uniref:Ribulose-phosphate 3-epimerase n=1 Tax=Tolumonas auensis (strain DSM 9187 / NBRC 110442 / TA 4) TaxID=595494 RepID=C4L7G1_TOLAT|nr:ribulose-phosphate 3-epimerase [Tolumonas auensis]ACQ93577.1 ribulose-phosphate 3-epimerase [Tolumonas auensis DSM 9187]